MGEAGEWIRIVGAGTYLGSTLLARNTNVLALDVQTVHPPRVRRSEVAIVPDSGLTWPKIQPVTGLTAVPHSGQVPETLSVRSYPH